ncbi:MAG TPA: NADH-ubiquinone oxidoreductase-F iron-sulfur binding region domain-containing protein [Atribacteraceae bacterium]|nr:NADH-ubiquinone oxidoreductase-F iron-sulfur binding region domain-containing protein [Atribacteraceae bacterium]
MPTVELETIKAATREKMAHLQYRVLVCNGTGCIANGARQVYNAFLTKTGACRNLVSVKTGDPCHMVGLISQTGCHGLCQMGPLVLIRANNGFKDVFYCGVREPDVAEIVEETIKKGRIVDRLLYTNPQSGELCRNPGEIPFYARQNRLALAECGLIDPESIEEYIQGGGYSMLRRAALEMTPREVCELIRDSGLRGRGGAGFPTGRKWLAMLEQPGKPGEPRYLVCNGDEGDPGAFMDRSLMEGDPHRLLEGAMIAAFAAGATVGYFYIRTEYPLAVQRVRQAINDARRLGILGENLFGSGFRFDCDVVEGAGAFVCGEETALLASIEGKRGMPRHKPPFPAQEGLFGKPTVVNNVETLATIRYIMEQGVSAFRRFGTVLSPGTKTFALTGRVRHTGLIEVPMGTTLREVIYEIGGGIPGDKKFKAAQIGGPSGGCLGETHLDLSLDFENLTALGAMVGSGGIVVMDEETCIVEVSRFFMQFTQEESCGKCVLCREGTKQMLALLQDIVDGTAELEHLSLLEETARAVKAASLCGLGKSAPNPVLSTLTLFRNEYLAHIERRLCPAGACQALKVYAVNPDLCKGCTLCVSKCPAGAIHGEKRQAHRIDVTSCTKCGVCATICKFKAITAA